MKSVVVALFSLCLLTSCDRESGRSVGRKFSEIPTAPVEKASDGIDGFIQGIMEKPLADHKRRTDAAVERMKREVSERQKQRDLDRIRRDKGFPGREANSGFSSHGKNKGFPAFE
jgi:50S ribosomal subunit-associated GTPase HflX